MWPLDSPRLWGSNGSGPKSKHKALLPLPSWLQPHCLLNFNHLCRVQVRNEVFKLKSIFTFQTLRLSQPEFESVLWPGLILCSTEVAAHSRSCLRKRWHQLRSRHVKSNEERIPPWIDGLQWDPDIPRTGKGLVSSIYLSEILSFTQDSPQYNAYDRDIAVVNIFFADSTVFGLFIFHICLMINVYKATIHIWYMDVLFAEFEKSPKMTWFDFISSLGGFCGLCLGISFVSVVEILYWFSIRLCRNFAIWIRTSSTWISSDIWKEWEQKNFHLIS